MVVVVAGVAEAGRNPNHRDRGVRQLGVRLGIVGHVEDLVDLIHCRGREWIERALDEIPCPMPVGRNENLCGLLELVFGQGLGRDVETGHRGLVGIVLHLQQEVRGLVEPGTHPLGLLDQLVDALSDCPAALGKSASALLHLIQLVLHAVNGAQQLDGLIEVGLQFGDRLGNGLELLSLLQGATERGDAAQTPAGLRGD